MNSVDYLFENTNSLKKDFILGTQKTCSYKYIYESSYKLAVYLQKKVGQENGIVLISQNSSFSIIAYLGILKSGNICIPLNPAIEQKNYDFILTKSKCSLGFISKKNTKNLNLQIDTLTEDSLELILNKEQEEHFEIGKVFDENRVAEVIYTSGSTATPKGVMISHKNIMANTNSIIQYLNLNENDIMLVVLPFFYCYGLSLLHTHLRIGGQLVLNNNFIFLTSTINNINKYNCTGFAGVPSHFQILLRTSNYFKNTEFPSLRYVTQAGGKLYNTFIEEFINSFPEIQFYKMYGQTEATARLSYLPPEKLKEKMDSIGKAIPGVELKVLNSEGQLISKGEVGEIIAKGDNIMSGYFEDSTETNAVLQNGWLYTGDLAEIDDEGYIYIVSRKKEIIKIAGKRISPREIEAVINSIPAVIDCTIEALEDDTFTHTLMATIVISGEANDINEEIVKQYCAKRLSSYKIPSVINFEKKMKFGATGKKTHSIRFNSNHTTKQKH